MESVEITCVTIDCRDPEKVATFWNEALRWGGVVATADSSGAVCGPTRGGMYLEFIRVPEPRTAKNRVHVDLKTDDREKEIARLLELGATRGGADHNEYGHAWTVMADPEANEFCIAGP